MTKNRRKKPEKKAVPKLPQDDLHTAAQKQEAVPAPVPKQNLASDVTRVKKLLKGMSDAELHDIGEEVFRLLKVGSTEL